MVLRGHGVHSYSRARDRVAMAIEKYTAFAAAPVSQIPQGSSASLQAKRARQGSPQSDNQALQAEAGEPNRTRCRRALLRPAGAPCERQMVLALPRCYGGRGDFRMQLPCGEVLHGKNGAIEKRSFKPARSCHSDILFGRGAHCTV